MFLKLSVHILFAIFCNIQFINCSRQAFHKELTQYPALTPTDFFQYYPAYQKFTQLNKSSLTISLQEFIKIFQDDAIVKITAQNFTLTPDTIQCNVTDNTADSNINTTDNSLGCLTDNAYFIENELTQAIRKNNIEKIQELLNNPDINPNTGLRHKEHNVNLLPPLYLAIEHANPAIVAMFLQHRNISLATNNYNNRYNNPLSHSMAQIIDTEIKFDNIALLDKLAQHLEIFDLLRTDARADLTIFAPTTHHSLKMDVLLQEQQNAEFLNYIKHKIFTNRNR